MILSFKSHISSFEFMISSFESPVSLIACPLESYNRDSKFMPNFEFRHCRENGPFLKDKYIQKSFILCFG